METGARAILEKLDDEMARVRDSWDHLRLGDRVRSAGRFLGSRIPDARPDIVSRDHGGDFDLSGLVDRVHRLWNYRGEKTPGPAKAVAQALMPVPVEEVGRQIEAAAKEYGAVRVATAAAAGGLLAGFLAKKFGQI